MAETFRIQGVPLAWDAKQLQDLLDTSSGDAQPRVSSLALEIHKRTQTATVTFMKVSQPLQNKKDWNIPLSSDPAQIEDDSVDLDDGFAGITTLYNPPPDEHNIDIIAISRIGGHAFGSFKKKGGNYMWLRDALPKDIPTARIMIYGYNSTIASSTSMQNLEDLATSFRDSLLPLVRSDTLRPIIFIGHSLGGLIVKQALTILSKSQRDADIKLIQAVYGIVFFGVPNHGMDITSLVLMAGDGPNRFLIESINFHNSQILDILHRDFQVALGKQGESEIVCFYETERSPTAKQDDDGKWTMDGEKALLVSKNSATNCRSWEIGAEHICSIARSNSNMVKFGRHDEEYEKVCERIRDVCQRARICPKTHNSNGRW
ncbi:hypothetical protein ACQKWADRAFT_324692 [Trichoderma austrokoningii]